MTRTRFLLALLVFVVLIQVFPEKTDRFEQLAVFGGASYAVGWALTRYRSRHRRRSDEAAQQRADDDEYQRYRAELDQIRSRYDAPDPTSLPPALKEDLNALHDRHHEMLGRRFGPR